MPCDMMGGTTVGYDHSDGERLERRVAALEEAMCGLCQTLSSDESFVATFYPQLQKWWDAHRKQPGCEAGRK